MFRLQNKDTGAIKDFTVEELLEEINKGLKAELGEEGNIRYDEHNSFDALMDATEQFTNYTWRFRSK